MATARQLRLPIRRRLLAAFMLAVALPLLATALYLRLWTARSLVAGALREVASDRKDGARILEGSLAGAQDDALFLSRAPEVVALAKALEDAGSDDATTEEPQPMVSARRT